MEQHSFGYWLRLKRKSLDLTREELAERVGYSAATLRKIEDEERHPSVPDVERLAQIFNIPQNERAAFLRFGRGDGRVFLAPRMGEAAFTEALELGRAKTMEQAIAYALEKTNV